MNLGELKTLLAYNAWANSRVLEPASTLLSEQLAAPVPGLSFGNLLGTLTHVYNAEYVWRKRYQEGVSVPSLTADFFPNLEALQAVWSDNTGLMNGFFS